MSALVLALVLTVSFAGCSKKNQSQNQQPANPASPAQENQPSATTSQAGQPAQNQQPMAQATAQQQQAAQPAAPPPPPPIVVPAGTSVVVRMGNTINTKTANAGDTFTGSVAHPVAVNGEVAIPAGAGVTGTVVESKSPGKFKGEGVLAIALTSINVRGVPTTVETSQYAVSVKGKGKRTAVMAGGGTGAGALIGGLAGGGKGALIGGLVGAGAGTAGAAFTGNKEVQIPAEAAVTFKLSNSITVTPSGKKGSEDQSGNNPSTPTQ
ncbi:MAG TPA: hypothetical protein VL240_03860 [Candidatus Binatia bacterium]|nr:hypothetical protein [Candidatus Binatia bacterium]